MVLSRTLISVNALILSVMIRIPSAISSLRSLNRSATIYKAQGAFSHHSKTVIMTTMKRSQAVRLRNYIKKVEPTAFILISNSSEIIGKGFLSN